MAAVWCIALFKSGEVNHCNAPSHNDMYLYVCVHVQDPVIREKR